jgi:hypothetical protein
MKDYETKMINLSKRQGKAEHDILKYSLIQKANYSAVQSIYDADISKAQTLTDDQLLENGK